MERREALKRVAYLMGGAISATTMGVLFESFTVLDKSKVVNFSVSDEAILAEFAEIIIPTTAACPGAKAAGLHIGYYHFASLNDPNVVNDADIEAVVFDSAMKLLPKHDFFVKKLNFESNEND